MNPASKALAPQPADGAPSTNLPAKPLQILHFEKRREDSRLVQTALEAERVRCEILRVDSCADFLTALHECRIDVVIADFFDPTLDGLTLLQYTHGAASELPVIFFAAGITRECSDKAMRHGAAEAVLKTE